MRLLNIFIFLILTLNPIFSYSNSNSKFNEIENKINYLNNRIGFLYFEIEKAQQIIFRTTALVSKKERFRAELEEHLKELCDCRKTTKIKSADFRLQKWLYTYFKKLKSQQKHINHHMLLLCCEINKSNLDHEVVCLKEHAKNLDEDSYNFLICSLNKLVKKIEDFQDTHHRLKKEENCIIDTIENVKSIISKYQNQFCNCCCWI